MTQVRRSAIPICVGVSLVGVYSVGTYFEVAGLTGDETPLSGFVYGMFLMSCLAQSIGTLVGTLAMILRIPPRHIAWQSVLYGLLYVACAAYMTNRQDLVTSWAVALLWLANTVFFAAGAGIVFLLCDFISVVVLDEDTK